MVKTYTVTDKSSLPSIEDYPNDATHTQLFYRTTATDSSLGLTPSYYREVQRSSDHPKLYWFSAALKMPQQPPNSSSTSTPSSTLLWAIEPIRVKRTHFLRRARLPHEFTITYVPTVTRCTFRRCRESDGPEYCASDVVTPFDATSVQRYRWRRKSANGETRWLFVAQNAVDCPLVEFRPSAILNEYEIEFLQPAPSGWSPYIADRMSRFSGFTGGRASGFVSTPDSRDSRASIVSNSLSGMSWRVSDENANKEEDTRYWEEFVLATTVVVQDEMNTRPSRSCNKILPFC
jgi:hypothetical protein